MTATPLFRAYTAAPDGTDYRLLGAGTERDVVAALRRHLFGRERAVDLYTQGYRVIDDTTGARYELDDAAERLVPLNA